MASEQTRAQMTVEERIFDELREVAEARAYCRTDDFAEMLRQQADHLLDTLNDLRTPHAVSA